VLAVEQPGQQPRLRRLQELLLGVGLRLVGVALRAHRGQLPAQRVRRRAQHVDGVALQFGGAEHDADREREEHGDDRDEVVSEVDHLNSPVNQ
jgi:hypothetical protein